MNIFEKALKKSTINPRISEPTADSLNKVQATNYQKNEQFKGNPIQRSVKTIDSLVAKRIVDLNFTDFSGRGIFFGGEEHYQIIEEMRSIKRPLMINAVGPQSQGIENSNLILVTSSMPGEGKTFTAINLALSIANERDKKVLLIDADVAKPSISKELGLKEGLGLVDYLESDEVDFSDIVLETNISGLKIIPAGKRHHHSTELLASDKMRHLSEELANRYSDRIVIIDSPPVLAATQADVLAGLVGQVVFVIGAGVTSRNIVKEGLRKLEDCDVVLGLLNRVTRDLSYNYYGYGNYGVGT